MTNLCPICQVPIRKNTKHCTLHRAMTAMERTRKAAATLATITPMSKTARLLYRLKAQRLKA